MSAPRGEERAVDRLLVLERQALGGQRQQRRGAAGDQAQHQIVGTGAFGVFEHPARGVTAGGIRDRMRRLDHLDPGASHGVAVAGHDQAFDRPRPCGLDRARHRRRGLAGAEHDGASGGRRGQMRREDGIRQGRLDRGVQQPAKEGSRLACHPGPVPTLVQWRLPPIAHRADLRQPVGRVERSGTRRCACPRCWVSPAGSPNLRRCRVSPARHRLPG